LVQLIVHSDISVEPESQDFLQSVTTEILFSFLHNFTTWQPCPAEWPNGHFSFSA